MRIRRRLVHLFLPIAILIFSQNLMAQQEGIVEIRKQFSRDASVYKEKCYVHTDKEVYLTGEVLWLKALVVEASTHKLAAVSKVGYVELLASGDRPITGIKIDMHEGYGSGSIFIAQNLATGNYKLRAYTNWMKNFGPDGFFEKTITIINPEIPVPKDMASGEDSLFLDFFPEGGDLVHGIESRVAFLGSFKSGKQAQFIAYIVNAKNDTVAQFSSSSAEPGSFMFTPDRKENYRVVVPMNGKPANFNLPAIREHGYVVQLVPEGKQVRVKVLSTPPGSQQLPIVYMAVHAHKKLSFISQASIAGGSAEFMVNTSLLQPGVNTFTVFDHSRRPVAERVFFKKGAAQMRLVASTSAASFGLRQKVEVQLDAPDDTASELSLSVYRLNSSEASGPDIHSYLWMGSELNSFLNIKVTGDKANQNEEVDLLMLTYGWRRFTTDAGDNHVGIFSYLPEVEGHVVEGSVTDRQTGLPVADAMIYLSIPSSTLQFYTSYSDSAGKVRFLLRDYYGPGEMIIQTDPQFRDVYQVEIATPFFKNYSGRSLPAFIPQQTLKPYLDEQSLAVQVQNTFYEDRLRSYLPPSSDSTGFFLKPDASYFLDNYKRFTTMEEVIREYVPGVTIRRRDGKWNLEMVSIHRQEIFYEPLVLIDGVPLFSSEEIIQYDPLKIRKLDLVLRRYFYGPSIFTGIASFSTYNHNLDGYTPHPKSVILDYDGLQLQRQFFSPRYETVDQKNSRLPDYRTLLHWEPSVPEAAGGKRVVEFYTSDQPGRYKIVVEGINKNGEAGSATAMFEVKE